MKTNFSIKGASYMEVLSAAKSSFLPGMVIMVARQGRQQLVLYTKQDVLYSAATSSSHAELKAGWRPR